MLCCPLCYKEMTIVWRAPFKEPVFDRKNGTYEMVRQPAAFVGECQPCAWKELYTWIPGTKIHAAQWAEMINVFEKYSK